MPTHVEFVTPAQVLYSGDAEFVVMRTEGGDIMFLPEHADFVGAVDICVLRIATAGAEASGDPVTAGTNEVRAAVAGGFVHVADNNITVVAAVAELADDIDVGRARNALDTASTAEGPDAAPDTGEEQVHGPAMLALLHPDYPEVRARRARVRLEAAGALDGLNVAGSGTAGGH